MTATHRVRYVLVNPAGDLTGDGETPMGGDIPAAGSVTPDVVAARWTHTAETVRKHLAERGQIAGDTRVVIFDVAPL